MTRLLALLRFGALLLPIGVLCHLLADAFDVPGAPLHALTASHAILGLLGAAGLAWTLRWLHDRRRDLRRQCALHVQSLPGHGGGLTFVLIGALLFGFIVSTQALEGSLAAISLAQAVIVASIVSAAGVAFAALVREVVPSLDEFVPLLPRRLVVAAFMPAWRSHLPYFAYVCIRGNRPPPHA